MCKVYRETRLSCFCLSSGPPQRPTNWSTPALRTSRKKTTDRLPFTHNHAFKSMWLFLKTLNDFKIILRQLPKVRYQRENSIVFGRRTLLRFFVLQMIWFKCIFMFAWVSNCLDPSFDPGEHTAITQQTLEKFLDTPTPLAKNPSYFSEPCHLEHMCPSAIIPAHKVL